MIGGGRQDFRTMPDAARNPNSFYLWAKILLTLVLLAPPTWHPVFGANMAGSASFTYRAFVSYSHRDRAWGEWLHGALEGYRIMQDHRPDRRSRRATGGQIVWSPVAPLPGRSGPSVPADGYRERAGVTAN